MRFFRNSTEYEKRLKTDFSPPTITLKKIHDAVPKHLLRRDQRLSAYYVLRDLFLAWGLFKFTSYIPVFVRYLEDTVGLSSLSMGWILWGVKWGLWNVYWWFQGVVWAGIFCLGHDAGHGTLFASSIVNNTIGFSLHTFLLIPYFAWRATHHAHHKATGSIERDENYVPHTRSNFNLPPSPLARPRDYAEIFEETPIWTLGRMAIMQGMGWWLYLGFNTLGSKMYPPGTNHFNPSSPLFKKSQRPYIILSNIGLVVMFSILIFFMRRFGAGYVFRVYGVPYLWTNHWIVMFTYLHHSDPTIPHYRKDEWTFLRGVLATVDRPLLGWLGRELLHNISHDHVAHHLFVKAPFYNGPEITKALKPVLGGDYNYDSTNTAYALYRSFTQCLFIEDDESIAFYKDKTGECKRRLRVGTDADATVNADIGTDVDVDSGCKGEYEPDKSEVILSRTAHL